MTEVTKLNNKSDSNNIDTYDKENIICPHCGEEYEDSQEFVDNGTEVCRNCGKKFKFEREKYIRYSTYSV